MATLTPTLTLTSSDATSDELNFSVTDSLSVTGDTVSISRVALSTVILLYLPHHHILEVMYILRTWIVV